MNNLPFLLVDRARALRNIERIVAKCRGANLRLRPHFKTHQSIEVGGWFRQFGVDAITVSSIDMAEFFAQNGWSNITIAFPVYPQMVARINELARKVRLGVIFASLKNLVKSVEDITSKIEVYIEVDVGNGRSGVLPSNTREIAMMVNLIGQNPHLTFAGFLTHAGQTYGAVSTDEILAIHSNSMRMLSQLRLFWKESYPDIIVSYGDTPSASIAEDFWSIDELRPGNFVYYDVMQSRIGSCQIADIAVALVAPVVDVYEAKGEALLHAGAVHLSKEYVEVEGGAKCFGLVCPFDGEKWGDPFGGVYLKSLSQEHGVVAFDAANPAPFAVGDLVAVLPVHSCLTADLMKRATVCR